MHAHLLDGDAVTHGNAMTLTEVINLRENITESLTCVVQRFTTCQHQCLVHEAQRRYRWFLRCEFYTTVIEFGDLHSSLLHL
jgi:hypothetical protein